ncbi:MAG TPA: Ig domain-containing protein [Bryobacteraceae bacterium]|nr:Ig domain-containing protein [Bryobacteraceae bacterium]
MNIRPMLLLSLAAALPVYGQSPVPPQINNLQSNPTPVYSGQGFTLTVNGSGFCSGAQVRFNNQPLSATFVNASQLQTTVSGSLTSGISGTVPVQVVNSFSSPCLGPGLSSNIVDFNILSTPTIVNTTLPNGTVGVSYNSAVQVTGGQPPRTYSVTGSFPPGLNLNPQSGSITGIPTAGGTFTFTVTVQDNFSNSPQVSRTYTVIITVPPLTVVTTSIPAGVVGTPYSVNMVVSGGVSPYRYITAAPPAPGLTLDPISGQLSGTPTQAGSFPFSISYRDSLGGTPGQGQNVVFAYTLIVAPALAVTTSSLPDGQVNLPYAPQGLTAVGGQSPYTWMLAGGAPQGLTISPSGILSGMPTQIGTFPLQIVVTDSLARQASATLPVTIVPPQLLITTNALPSGVQGTAYSTSLDANGGVPPYLWALTGGGPQGLTMSASGILSGTPTQAGTFNLQIGVTDSQGRPASKTLQLTIAPPQLQITTTSLPAPVAGVGYSAAIAATGGTPPYTFTTSSALPAGLSLTPGGVLSGSAQQSGVFPLSITVRDAANQTAAAVLSLTVIPVLQITTANIPSGLPGTNYSTQFLAAGGLPPYQWSAPGGTPPGLTLDAASGILSGSPALQGVYNFDVQVRDASNQTARRSFSLVVGTPLTITTTALRNALLGVPYDDAITAAGGTLPYTFSVVGGQVPGLFLNPGTGVLFGTPLLVGNFNLTVRVTDGLGLTAVRSFSILVDPGFRITTETLAAATVGALYEQVFSASGGAAPYLWSLSGSTAPGLALNATTGVLSGVPSLAGAFPFSVIVTDSLGQQAFKTLTLTVNQGVRITPEALPSGSVGVSYSQTFSASGGVAPYSLTILGAVPGLTFDPGTGQFRGTPTQAGSYEIVVRAIDNAGLPATRNYTLIIVSGLTITTASLQDGVERSRYSQTLAAAGGTAPYSWRISAGNLPEGLSLNAATGVISGFPTRAGQIAFTVEASDSTTQKATRSLTINILPGLVIQTAGTLSSGMVGSTYTTSLAATGGTPPYRWRVSGGGLPDGLALDELGRITGTASRAGLYTLTVEVTDSAGRTAADEIYITIQPPPLTITSGSQLPAATAGLDYQTLAVASGGTPAYRWSLNGAPAELSIDAASGTISGRMLTPGNTSFSIRVEDSAGVITSREVTLAVGVPAAPPAVVSGLPATSGAGQQLNPTVALGAPYLLPINGELILSFAPAAGVDDPAIQFASGGRRVAFNIPAGQTQAIFNAATAGLQTGTVAGTITVTARLTAAGTDVTPNPAPAQSLQIGRLAPVITALRVSRTSTGFEVIITAYATSREITSAALRLQTAGSVQGSEFTVNVAAAVGAWYQSTVSAQFGSLCTITIPFTVTGTSGTVSGLMVTLSNSLGTSQPSTVTF